MRQNGPDRGPKDAGNVASDTNRRLLTPEDVAQFTGLSVETLAQWRSQRRGIPFLKLSRNVVRYRQVDLDRWLSERIVRVEDLSPVSRGGN
jgi:predicted DNA-binding transcriptional regulator AlpA